MTTQVTRNDAENRYELYVAGTLAGVIDYRPAAGGRDLFHTGVFEEFSGQGLAAVLAAGALADLRADGLVLVPTCPYIQGYLRKHPEDLDLVSDETRQRLQPS